MGKLLGRFDFAEPIRAVRVLNRRAQDLLYHMDDRTEFRKGFEAIMRSLCVLRAREALQDAHFKVTCVEPVGLQVLALELEAKLAEMKGGESFEIEKLKTRAKELNRAHARKVGLFRDRVRALRTDNERLTRELKLARNPEGMGG